MYQLHHTTPVKQRHRLRAFGLLTILALTLSASGLLRYAMAADWTDAPQPLSTLALSEIQTGGCSNGNTEQCTEAANREFVELFNFADVPVGVDGWKLQYMSASGGTVTTLAELQGTVAARSYVLAAHGSYMPAADLVFGNSADAGKLARSGGIVRLVDAKDQIVDLVGWGTALTPQPWQTLAAMKPGYSIQRAMVTSLDAGPGQRALFSGPQTTGVAKGGGYNQAITTEPLPVSPYPSADPTSSDIPTLPPTPNPPMPDQVVAPSTPRPCTDSRLSELLPNPSGSDTGKEYIELYNPTDQPITLAGCSLATSSGSGSRPYSLPNTTLQAGEYRVFGSNTTGLTLPNGSGTVQLLQKDTVVHEVTYTKNMADDEAWANVDSTWQSTFTPTPGAANRSNPTENPVTGPSSELPVLAPCPAGQERNLETNRCRQTTDTPVTATVCKTDQVRNPDTNRCRAVTTLASAAPCAANETRNPFTNRCNKVVVAKTVMACKADQMRNPETGRCKAAAAANGKKACPTGQVRNPASGRCKKDTSAALTAAAVKDVRGNDQSSGGMQFKLLGIALLVALAYAAYEWRQDVRYWLSRLVSRRRIKPRAIGS